MRKKNPIKTQKKIYMIHINHHKHMKKLLTQFRFSLFFARFPRMCGNEFIIITHSTPHQCESFFWYYISFCCCNKSQREREGKGNEKEIKTFSIRKFIKKSSSGRVRAFCQGHEEKICSKNSHTTISIHLKALSELFFFFLFTKIEFCKLLISRESFPSIHSFIHTDRDSVLK